VHPYSETNLTTTSFRLQIIALPPDSKIAE